MRQTCVWHCGAATCNAHFHSLAAFDAHRADGYCAEEPLALMTAGEKRHPRLQVWTENGYCKLQTGAMKDGRPAEGFDHGFHPVTIYQEYVAEGRVAFWGKRDASQLALC